MRIVHSLAHVVHNPRWEFTRGRRIYSKDIPSRATLIREALEGCGMAIDWAAPVVHPPDLIAETHAYYRYLERASRELGPNDIIYPDVFPLRRKTPEPTSNAALAGYYCFDTATPLTRNVYPAAKGAVDVALTAADDLLHHGVVYALCRPPGHHAEREVFGGYSYFNNPALAAKQLLAHGRVAVLDIDYHHGNGTQEIFYERRDVFTVSIHGDPTVVYPYFSGHPYERGQDEGEGYNLNLPLAPGTAPDRFFETLDTALAAIKAYAPATLVVAVGFDTCRGDPAGSFDLRTKHYPAIARAITALGLPTLIVQEGGYATERLGANAVAFLTAFEKGVQG